MKILDLNMNTLGILLKYTLPNDKKVDFALSGEDFRKSVVNSCNVLNALVILKGKSSVYILQVKQGKFYNYFTDSEVIVDHGEIERVCLLIEYTKSDIEKRRFLPLPLVCEPASEYVGKLISERSIL